MSFRQFGGLNYSAKSNIITNQYSNSGNLGITDTLGQPNSKIVSQSHIDMSANSVLHIGSLYFMDGTVQSTAAANSSGTPSIFNNGIIVNGTSTLNGATSVTGGLTTDILTISSGGTITASTFIGNLQGNADTATSLANGIAYQIPYQTGAGATAFIDNATAAGQVLTSNSGLNGYIWSSASVPGNGALELTGTHITSTTGMYTANQSALSTIDILLDATDANTVNTIVARDGSGNFSAGTITAALSGNATTATTATNLSGTDQYSIPYQSSSGITDYIANGTNGYVLTSNTSSAPSWQAVNASTITTTENNADLLYPVMVNAAGANKDPYVDTSGLSYDALNNVLTTGSLALGGATLSTNALAVTGTTFFTGTVDILLSSSANQFSVNCPFGTTGGIILNTGTYSSLIKSQLALAADYVSITGATDCAIPTFSSTSCTIGSIFAPTPSKTININSSVIGYDATNSITNIGVGTTTTINIGDTSGNTSAVYIGGQAKVASIGNVGANSDDDNNAALNVFAGGAFIKNDLMVYGSGISDANIYGPAGGILTIGGGADIGGTLFGVSGLLLGNIITNPPVEIITETEASSTTTGALVVAGGVGISGDCYASSFNTSSDYRIKENIQNLDESFNVDNLRPITYKNKTTEKQDIGFIAHELQEEFPCLVTGEKDGENMQSLNYIGLIGVLVKEIQELKKRVNILENK